LLAERKEDVSKSGVAAMVFIDEDQIFH